MGRPLASPWLSASCFLRAPLKTHHLAFSSFFYTFPNFPRFLLAADFTDLSSWTATFTCALLSPGPLLRLSGSNYLFYFLLYQSFIPNTFARSVLSPPSTFSLWLFVRSELPYLLLIYFLLYPRPSTFCLCALSQTPPIVIYLLLTLSTCHPQRLYLYLVSHFLFLAVCTSQASPLVTYLPLPSPNFPPPTPISVLSHPQLPPLPLSGSPKTSSSLPVYLLVYLFFILRADSPGLSFPHSPLLSFWTFHFTINSLFLYLSFICLPVLVYQPFLPPNIFTWSVPTHSYSLAHAFHIFNSSFRWLFFTRLPSTLISLSSQASSPTLSFSLSPSSSPWTPPLLFLTCSINLFSIYFSLPIFHSKHLHLAPNFPLTSPCLHCVNCPSLVYFFLLQSSLLQHLYLALRSLPPIPLSISLC